MKYSIAIFASGSGTNAENIINYFKNNNLAEVRLVVTNNPNAFVIERAKKLSVPYKVFSNKSAYESEQLLDSLYEAEINFIVLAGFMWLVPPKLIENFQGRIVNIHPALLPKYGGRGMYGDRVHQSVSQSGETKTGITIHHVNENYDEGDIIFQATCDISAGENPDTIAEKVHSLEYKHYPRVIESLLKKLG